jgi:hypothetical protein
MKYSACAAVAEEQLSSNMERGTNFQAQPVFSTLATNLAGQLGTTVYADTNATGSRLFYYRVGVEE